MGFVNLSEVREVGVGQRPLVSNSPGARWAGQLLGITRVGELMETQIWPLLCLQAGLRDSSERNRAPPASAVG